MLAFNKTNGIIKKTDIISVFIENIKKWYIYITKNYQNNHKYRV